MSQPSESTSPNPSQRKPLGTTWESFVERRIREAQAEGAFDSLPGAGRPIPGIDDRLDENWWIKSKLRDEGVNIVPPLLAARLDRERTLEQLPSLVSESAVRQVLTALNERILAALKSPAVGPAIGVTLVEIDAAIANWRSQHL